MPVIGCLLYALLGLAQITAYIAGIQLWLGVGPALGLVIFFATAAVPFGALIDAAIAFYGAYAVWHWSAWQAALLSFPFAIVGAGGVVLASVGQLFNKLPNIVKKRSKKTAMDAVVTAAYGKNAPAKSANLDQSILIANEMLLYGAVPLPQVRMLAKGLYDGPMPYSTIDLAVATALAFYRNRDFHSALEPHQILARHHVLIWTRERKINLMLAEAFENSLYKDFKPQL